MHRLLSSAVLVVALSGCAAAGLWRVDSAGSPVQSVKALQAVDLPLALNPEQRPAPETLQRCIDDGGHGPNCTKIVPPPEAPELFDVLGFNVSTETAKDRGLSNYNNLERLRLEWALQAFYDTNTQVYGSKEDRRNRLQERLISASDTNCQIFAENVFAVQATGNFAFGSAATALGGAGAIVTGVDAARILSGLAGITSGIRAEMNEDYFRTLWVEAVLKGIETDRDQRRTDMRDRQGETIAKYPVEAAIADAIRYNAACSLVSGLKEVNQAVVIAADPVGLKTFQDVYSRAGFNPSFTLEISSENRSHRLAASAQSTAVTAVATGEIQAALSQVKIAETDAVSRLTKPEQAPALQNIHDSSAHISDTITPYLAQLTTMQTKYNDFVTALGKATSEADRQFNLDQIHATDDQAKILRDAALQLIQNVQVHIADVVAQQTAPPPPSPRTNGAKPPKS